MVPRRRKATRNRSRPRRRPRPRLPGAFSVLETFQSPLGVKTDLHIASRHIGGVTTFDLSASNQKALPILIS